MDKSKPSMVKVKKVNKPFAIPQLNSTKTDSDTKKTVISLTLLFLFINYLNPNSQALVMVICSLYPIFSWIKQKRVESIIFLFILLLLAGTILSTVSQLYRSLYYVISELKIIMLMTLPSFFCLVLEGRDYKKITTHFFKAYVLITAGILTYGSLVLGISRYTSFLDHSIYISVSLVLLMSSLYDHLSFKWKLLTLYSVFLLGSSNGIIIFFIVITGKSGIAFIYKLLTIILGSGFSYWYITIYRGRGVTDGGFWEIDRVIILSSILRYVKERFNAIHYFFGFGVGRPLDGIRIVTRTYSDDIRGFVNWFHSITSEGVYPYSFHNELLRISFNFGIVGVILIGLYLYKHMDKVTFIALIVACLTNTIIYSTVGLFILSLIMAVTMLDKEHLNEERSVIL